MKRIIKLTESDLTRIVRRVIIEQQAYTIIPITIDIPAQKNEEGVLKAIPNQRLTFQIINQKGTAGSMTDDLNTVSQVHWKDGSAKAVSNKDNKGNIIGSFVPDEAGLKVLSRLVGKNDMTGTSGIKVTIQPQNQLIPAPATVRFKERPIQK
jgi:hypothetical protein